MKLFIATTKNRSHVIMVVAETEEQARVMARNTTKIPPEEFVIHITPNEVADKAPFQSVKLDKRLKSTKVLLDRIDQKISLTSKVNLLNDEIDRLDDEIKGLES